MSLSADEAPSDSPGSQSANGLRVLFLDPIGHLFGNLDHAICEGLVDQGCEVMLGTNERAAPRGAQSRYLRSVPYQGVVGDAAKVWKFVNFLRSRRRILEQVECFKPDIVVLYYVIEPRLDAQLVRKLKRLGVATVVCAHDVISLDAGQRSAAAHRRLYAAANRVVVFSDYAREQLIRTLDVPAHKVSASFLGVDLLPEAPPDARALARGRLGIDNDETVLLCFGQIKKNKGLDILLKAFAKIAPQHLGVRLWVVGRPWHVDTKPFVELAESLGLQDRVVFRFHWVSRDEVDDWFHAADQAVLSYTHLYQSAVAGRACAHGLPLVATRVGHLPEMLEDERTAWMVDGGDVTGLAAQLDAALSDPEEAARRGQAARETVRARFSWPAFAQEFASILASSSSQDPSRADSGVKVGDVQPLRIALVGTRGIPANYGGYETFAEEISTRLAARGHDITVYGRTHHVPRTLKSHRGVKLISLPTIRTKYLDTVVSGFLSSLHVMFGPYDIVLMCNVINSPFCLIPRLCGKKVLMNVDGLDWMRKKWNSFGRRAALLGARMAGWFPHHLITDARWVQRFYMERFHAESFFIAYGSMMLDAEEQAVEGLDRWGLTPRGYLLYVSRLEPENNAHIVIEAFQRVKTELQLVIVGDAPYSDAYIQELKSTKDSRVRFLGGVYGKDYMLLQQNSYLYIQATEVGGTHPALLEGMGAGRCIVYNDVPEHREVLGEAGLPYRDAAELTGVLQNLADDAARTLDLGAQALTVARRSYDWEIVTDRYESLFFDVLDGGVYSSRLERGEAAWRDVPPRTGSGTPSQPNTTTHP